MSDLIIKILFLPTLLLGSITLLSRNLLVWWRVLIVTTLVFLTAVKTNMESYRIVKYFIIQEAARLTIGVLILFSIPLLLIRIMIMIKVALAPFHFWVITALHSLNGWPFRWVVTFQKLPGILILTQLMDNKGLVLLILGRALCSLQIILVSKPKTVILLSTTVTSSWVVITIFDNFFNLVFLSTYFVGVALLLNERVREQSMNVEYILILVLIRFPLTLIFMFKVGILLITLKFSVPLLLLFLISTLGATLAYMEILKFYVTTREGHFKLANNKVAGLLGLLLILLIIF